MKHLVIDCRPDRASRPVRVARFVQVTRSVQVTRRSAFTLIELLVVLSLLLLLTAIALPTLRDLIADQRIAKTARGLTTFIDAARNRAIAEGRQVGVVIERLGTDPRGRAHSIRVNQLTSVPPYSGDASDAVATLLKTGVATPPPPPPPFPVALPAPLVTVATFDPADNQLLALSASMVGDPSDPTDDDPRAPIRNGDYIELPGGRIVPFWFSYRDLSINDPTNPDYLVRLNFYLNEPLISGAQRFPASNVVTTPRVIKYKIHRRPVLSGAAPFDLPRGVAIDLNYSGFGVAGNEYAPAYDFTQAPPTPLPAYDVVIIFGPDGKVVSVSDPVNGALVSPVGRMFFCLGDADGIREDNLFAQERKATASVLNLESLWIVLNPNTGSAVASPFAPVSTIPAGVITDPTDLSVVTAIAESRLLANLSDTVELE